MENKEIEEIVDGIFSRLGKDFVLAFKQLTVNLGDDYYKFGFMDCRTVGAKENRKKVMAESIKFIDNLVAEELKRITK